jgi:hypothetical protein
MVRWQSHFHLSRIKCYNWDYKALEAFGPDCSYVSGVECELSMAPKMAVQYTLWSFIMNDFNFEMTLKSDSNHFTGSIESENKMCWNLK